MAGKAQATRERILDAAEALFAAEGYAGVTVRQIMKRAGADVALAYYHFESKRDLFDAVLMRRAEHLNEIRLKVATATTHPRSRRSSRRSRTRCSTCWPRTTTPGTTTWRSSHR